MRTREYEIADAISTLCLFNLGSQEIRTITVTVEGESFRIEIAPSKGQQLSKEPIWDQVTIDGNWYGNRCGGRSALMIMLGIMEPLNEFADRHAIARRDAIQAKGVASYDC